MNHPNRIHPLSVLRQGIVPTVALALHSASLFLIVALLARRADPASLGHYVLGYAIGAPVFMLLNARQRLVLVNHIAQGDPTWSLVRTRLVTSATGALGISALAFALWGTSSPQKALVISLVGAVKAAEAVSDIMYGGLQKAGEGRRVLFAICTRSIASAAATTAAIWFTHNAVAAALTLFVVWASQALIDARHLHHVNPYTRQSIALHQLLRSACATAMHPLAIVAVLASLAYYVPRYFLNEAGGDAALGIFGALSYFGSILQMLGYAISDALMPGLTQRHREGLASARYLADVRRLYGVLLAMGMLGVATLLLIGKPLLTGVLGSRFADRASLTAGLLAAGTLMAVGSCQSHAMVALGMHRVQLIAALGTFALLVACCAMLVPRSGMTGAVISDLVYAAVSVLTLEWLLARRIHLREVAA